MKRCALLLLRTKHEEAFKNTYKNQLLVVFFNGREILRVIAVELHNVTGRLLGQFCQFLPCYFAPKTSTTPLRLELLAFGGKK